MNKPNIRDEYNIPAPLLQARFLELLKVNSLLLELVLSINDVLGRGKTTAILAHPGKMRGDK